MVAIPVADDNSSHKYDEVISLIVDYVYDYRVQEEKAWVRAKAALIDALGAAIESIHTSAECARLVGPAFPVGPNVSGLFRLPGTSYQLDILKGAFDMGSMIRYLDHNDAFPGAEWGHPSDNLGAILATADIASQVAFTEGDGAGIITMGQVLEALVKAYEIQGCFQIRNAFNKVGLDHVILVKVAATAVVCWLLRLSREQASSAVSHAWMDGHPLRVYRQAPNTGPRKGWAAGDACMRAVHLALLAKAGQPGATTVLTEPRWGFYHVLFNGNKFELPRPFGTWVIETVLFKVNTAEGHGMTAIEAALDIGKTMRERGLDPAGDIEAIHIRTQEPGMIIINKQGPLHNAADRDHCLRYMVAVVLLKGSQIQTADYQDDSPWATDPRVEALRQKITMTEDPSFTQDYHDPNVRSVSNAISVQLTNGTALDEVTCHYPLGHFRREETLDRVYLKAVKNLELRLSQARVEEIMTVLASPEFGSLPACQFIQMFRA
ncbi:MmgE/PrpD family-domain-containing protein [Aspergillus floccosus]